MKHFHPHEPPQCHTGRIKNSRILTPPTNQTTLGLFDQGRQTVAFFLSGFPGFNQIFSAKAKVPNRHQTPEGRPRSTGAGLESQLLRGCVISVLGAPLPCECGGAPRVWPCGGGWWGRTFHTVTSLLTSDAHLTIPKLTGQDLVSHPWVANVFLLLKILQQKCTSSATGYCHAAELKWNRRGLPSTQREKGPSNRWFLT